MRYIEEYVLTDLQKKMVFLSGPRQVGKTHLSKSIALRLNQSLPQLQQKQGYLLWDDEDDQKAILKKLWSETIPLVVFDELHKFPRWKNWIKGVWDKHPENQRYLVTGSARLNEFKKGGDSLLGRYHHWRLHPFCLREKPSEMTTEECFSRLLTQGGFPESFFASNEQTSKRWRKERLDQLIREDLRDLEQIREVRNVELLYGLLRERATSEVVYEHLRNDLQVSLDSVKRWIEALEKLYVCFVIRPYAGKLSRSIQKTPKVYFYDNGDVPLAPDGGKGAKFENLVATHLLKQLHFLEDRDGDRWELCYIRDKEKREVDFAIVKNGVLDELIEVKWAFQPPTKSLLHFKEKAKPRLCTLIHADTKSAQWIQDVQVLPFADAFQSWERT
jgi:uncharacterized protein